MRVHSSGMLGGYRGLLRGLKPLYVYSILKQPSKHCQRARLQKRSSASSSQQGRMVLLHGPAWFRRARATRAGATVVTV